ncbi:MAG: hypothetical protein K9J16_16775 [Melioribacteraceae bacterium]|nr:hypothetical protein [Melioribacteraceae bacterium]MCF8356460.1 hypothetical protein [Melioribacteraceae bacterium]MCF8395848.1 hypothetical protein [Melioribacteraceae bacterium]MCF8420932.1 hypothetical protein [Melioribacteraceae bacterium]
MKYEELIYDLVQKDKNYFILTAENRAAIRNLPEKITNNFLDTGISEQTLIGVSAGLALRGRKPIAHVLASFLTMRAFEFIRTDIGIPNLPVKMVGAFAGFLSEANGPTHQAIEDISLMRGIPNINVFCPSDEDDMILGLPEVLKSDSPFYIRYNNLKSVVEHNRFKIGKAESFGEGNEVVIMTYGTLFSQAIEVMSQLKGKGIDASVINFRTLKPIDEGMILSKIKNVGLVVTLEDHFLTGGLFSILSELLLSKGLTANVLPIALNNKWFKPALLKNVLEYEEFSAEKLTKRILKTYKIKKESFYAEWSNI